MSSFVVPVRNEKLVRVPLFCRVEPLQRPRASVIPGQGFATIYQPKKNQRVLLSNLSALTPMAYAQPLIIDIYINLAKARTSKLDHPTGRTHGDEDNLRKAVLDAMVANGHLKDDSLVVGGQTLKAFGDEDFTVIDIFSVKPELVRYDV